MRGVSALEEVLAASPEKSLRVFVVWEPVIVTDVAPPTNGVLSRIPDPRVAQFWDPSLALSRLMTQGAAGAETSTPESVVWDQVLIYAPGGRWEEAPPPADFSGGPVVDVIEGLRGRLGSVTGL